LGEYSALVATKSLSLKDAVKLVVWACSSFCLFVCSVARILEVTTQSNMIVTVAVCRDCAEKQ